MKLKNQSHMLFHEYHVTPSKPPFASSRSQISSFNKICHMNRRFSIPVYFLVLISFKLIINWWSYKYSKATNSIKFCGFLKKFGPSLSSASCCKSKINCCVSVYKFWSEKTIFSHTIPNSDDARPSDELTPSSLLSTQYSNNNTYHPMQQQFHQKNTLSSRDAIPSNK